MTKSQKEAINEVEMIIGGNAQGIIKIICGILNVDYEAENSNEINTPKFVSTFSNSNIIPNNKQITKDNKPNALDANNHPVHYPIEPGKPLHDYFTGD